MSQTATPDPTETISLDRWATERSRADSRVELLNAFVTVSRAQHQHSATRTEWDARYSAFATRTVS